MPLWQKASTMHYWVLFEDYRNHWKTSEYLMRRLRTVKFLASFTILCFFTFFFFVVVVVWYSGRSLLLVKINGSQCCNRQCTTAAPTTFTGRKASFLDQQDGALEDCLKVTVLILQYNHRKSTVFWTVGHHSLRFYMFLHVDPLEDTSPLKHILIVMLSVYRLSSAICQRKLSVILRVVRVFTWCYLRSLLTI